MLYQSLHILNEDIGNNSFSYQKRQEFHEDRPYLSIPCLIEGRFEDVEIGDKIAFEEYEDGELKSCRGLKNFIRIKDYSVPITVFDNHNHALYFWLEALKTGKIEPGFELIHIDEHSDLWKNENILEPAKAMNDLKYAWEFTNFSCNVGNYIAPAKECGIIGNMIRIENEFQLDAYMDYIPGENTVLNIDLDFFAPEMDFIEDEKKYRFIRRLLSKVSCITIATSPFFIDQKRALSALRNIFEH